MYQIKNFTDNDDVKILDSMGAFTVIEYQRALIVMPMDAQLAYYCNAMNVRKRQVVCDPRCVRKPSVVFGTLFSMPF